MYLLFGFFCYDSLFLTHINFFLKINQYNLNFTTLLFSFTSITIEIKINMKNNYQLATDRPVAAVVERKHLDSDTVSRTIQAVTQLTSGNVFIINNKTLDIPKTSLEEYCENKHGLDCNNQSVNNNTLYNTCCLFSDFLSQIPVNRRLEYSISYDFEINDQSGKKVLYNHKITPLSLSQNGRIEMSLCIASVSMAKSPGNLIISSKLSDIIWKYCKESEKWHPEFKIKLTARETDIVRSYLQGYTIDEIASKLFITGATVKWHRRKLFEKLNVKNITEAISCLVINNLL